MIDHEEIFIRKSRSSTNLQIDSYKTVAEIFKNAKVKRSSIVE